MADSSVLPGLERKPGDQNWVDRLPAPLKAAWHRSWIYRAAKHLAAESAMPVGRAIAVAVNAAKRGCATGDLNFKGLQQVNAKSRAEMCAAVVTWDAMRAAAKADTSIPAEERRQIDLTFQLVDRWADSQVVDLADVNWNPLLHPRDLLGQFTEVLDRLKIGSKVHLPDGVSIEKKSKGRFTVAGGGRVMPHGPHAYGAAIPSRISGSRRAARDAITRSARNRHPKSLGGDRPANPDSFMRKRGGSEHGIGRSHSHLRPTRRSRRAAFSETRAKLVELARYAIFGPRELT